MKYLNKTSILLGAAFSILFLSGCEDEGMESLDQKIAKIKSETKQSVEPLPKVAAYEPFTYSASDMRSPFARLDPEIESRTMVVDGNCETDVRPDPNRQKNEMEKFGLDALQYMGMIANKKELRGLVKILSGDSAGVIQPVHEGEYIGLNDGRISKIDSNQITIEAIIPNGRGCWENRTQYLVLGQ
ncbi:pilus assembly protein PilP [Kangiella sediminilitoris]|uniref:Pilus assembly protein PilP n=1 Tax=Kangiella sediminilitoris TaxID=1144748 RepID=A0A1B3B8G3_9GAMM|nr:pilus assembly protein PilP [Kangiella sediminilitoris]AOE49092.1 Pilus assembly protein PilP [Kangiella sediminilitoris]